MCGRQVRGPNGLFCTVNDAADALALCVLLNNAPSMSFWLAAARSVYSEAENIPDHLRDVIDSLYPGTSDAAREAYNGGDRPDFRSHKDLDNILAARVSASKRRVVK